jgi:polar amino acid transport system substrate-binding protein
MKQLARLGFATTAVVVLAALVAGCTSTDRAATDRAETVFTAPPSTVAPPTTTTTAAVDPQCTPNDPSRSLRPPNTLPPPGQMPVGTTMVDIQGRQTLRVGVDQNTLLFGYRNPQTNQLEGFDIDVARQVAQAIFGNPDAITYVVVTTNQRADAVAGTLATPPTVDMVASLYTINCQRWSKLSFSTAYYRAAQAILVPQGSKIQSREDLTGKRVCVTAGGTASTNAQLLALSPKLHPVAERTECLALLQDGVVDAIVADDTILYGFKAQDRTTKILQDRLTDEPYGLAINKDHPDFVRFVNGVLARMRADGTLFELENRWLGGVVDPLPQVPDASYRD